MTQAEIIQEALDIIQKNQPQHYEKLLTETPEETAARTIAVINGDPTIFKARPQGATNLVCYWIAEFNYAQALATCDLISDPNLRKQCKMSAKQVYCDAFDACAKA